MKAHKLTLIGLAAVTAVACAIQGPSVGATAGDSAPVFALPNMDGKTINLGDYKGKYVVLEWVNKDCPFVVKHYRSGNMQETQKKAKEMGAVWLSICSSNVGKQGYMGAGAIKDHFKAAKFNAADYLLDVDGKVGKAYGAKTTPQLVLIDPKGNVLYNGAIDDKPTANADDIKGARNHILAALGEAMDGKEVSVKTSRPYGCSVKY